MDGVRQAVLAAAGDVKRHIVVIAISVTVAVLIRWAVLVLIPLIVIGSAAAFWRHGCRVVIDRTHNTKEEGC